MIINEVNGKLVRMKELPENEHEKTDDEQNMGTIEGTDEVNLIICEKVDSEKRENTGEEEGENVDWQTQDHEKEREKLVPQPPSEAGSIATQVDNEELEVLITEEKLIELEGEAETRFPKKHYTCQI